MLKSVLYIHRWNFNPFSSSRVRRPFLSLPMSCIALIAWAILVCSILDKLHDTWLKEQKNTRLWRIKTQQYHSTFQLAEIVNRQTSTSLIFKCWRNVELSLTWKYTKPSIFKNYIRHWTLKCQTIMASCWKYSDERLPCWCPLRGGSALFWYVL